MSTGQDSLFNKEDYRATQTINVPRGEPQDWWTLAQVRQYCRERADKGLDCPVCRQRIKVYKRKLNRTMAFMAVKIYRRYGAMCWFHLPTFAKESSFSPSVYGDTTKLVHWGILENKTGEQNDGNPSTGMYRLTEYGESFVLDNNRVPKYIRLYNDRKLKCDDASTVNVAEALTDKFSYKELMHT